MQPLSGEYRKKLLKFLSVFFDFEEKAYNGITDEQLLLFLWDCADTLIKSEVFPSLKELQQAAIHSAGILLPIGPIMN